MVNVFGYFANKYHDFLIDFDFLFGYATYESFSVGTYFYYGSRANWPRLVHLRKDFCYGSGCGFDFGFGYDFDCGFDRGFGCDFGCDFGYGEMDPD